jgi:hypothetical protein
MSVNVTDVSTPEIYLESQDFRFFLQWFDKALATIKANTENFYDNYDPLRCPKELLWLLADTMGFKYDDRVSPAFNRMVLLYFMSMIKNKGSKDGVTLAAEVNLAQLSVMDAADENPALNNRLEDTSIPVNSAYVQAFTEQAYIDVVYFSTQVPVDTCLEYVRPLGMYCFQHAGVQFQGRTRVTVDARLTDSRDVGMSYGPTQVGHYTRADYASLQKSIGNQNDSNHTRRSTYYRNSKYERTPGLITDPGYRSLYSLQLSNNENIFKSLIYDADGTPREPDEIFTIGFGPQDVGVTYPDDYRKPPYQDPPLYNLRVDVQQEQSMGTDVYTTDTDRTKDIVHPRPAVNPSMGIVGTAISMNPQNTQYSADDGSGHIVLKDTNDL